MAEKSTWVKLDRNILEWEWYQNANTMRLFIHLILKANIKDCRFEGIVVRRGQLVTSYPKLSQELSLSVQAARTAINHLKSTGEITVKRYPNFSLVTLMNYERYQDVSTVKSTGKQQSSNRLSTVNQQQSKNIRNKECKEVNIAAVAESREWENNIPEEFRGMFASEAAWIEFCDER